jgi:protein O-mannosyl-transferase
MKTNQYLILFACLSTFFITLAYLSGINGPFIFDDAPNITSNSLIRIGDSFSLNQLINATFSGSAGPLKRPVAVLSFIINYYFSGGYAASAYKLTNIAIHCVNAILAFILCLQLLKRSTISSDKAFNHKAVFLFASGISLLWALHPINLTSVLYIVQRMTSLSTLFSLGCIILYLSARNRWLKQGFSRRVGSLLTASVISLLLALFSKENAVLIPLIIVLIELVLYSKEKPWSLIHQLSKQIKLISFVVIAALAIAALWWAIDYASGGFNNRPFTMLERILTESRVLCFYISLILIPRINGFGLFHDDIAISTSLLSPWTTLTSIIFILGLLATAFYYRKKNPLFSLGIGWFFVGHLLESTFFALEIAHEHRNNLPSIGIIIAAFALIPLVKIDSKKVVLSVLFIALILGSTTWLRAKQWGNYQTLAYYEAEHHPESPAIQALLSNAAHQAGDVEIATEAIKKAMTLDPNETAYALHYQNILAINDKEIPSSLQLETLRRFRDNKLTPSTQLALDQIAGCLSKDVCAPLRKNYLAWIGAAIEKSPKHAVYYYMKGKAQRASGDTLGALNSYQQAYDISPNFLHPLFEMADILIRLNQLAHAEQVIGWIEIANEKTPLRRDAELKKIRDVLDKIKKARTR